MHFLLGHQSLSHFAGEHLRSTHAILSSELSVFPPPILVNPVCARWAQGDEYQVSRTSLPTRRASSI